MNETIDSLRFDLPFMIRVGKNPDNDVYGI